MNIDTAIRRLKKAQKLSELDPEAAHVDADEVLEKFLESIGYEIIVDEYRKVKKWYS